MKRLICLFLACVVCLSFSACGKNSVEADSEVNTTAFAIDEKGSVDFTEEQLVKHIEKVELTSENWMLYFEDYCREKAVERVNSFGEVTYDKEYSCDFGLKEGIVASFHDVAFKFSDYELCHGKNSQIAENGYYLVDFGNSVHTFNLGRHYTKYECIDVTGDIYIYSLPEEVKSFTINGYPKGDEYSMWWGTPEGDYISGIYNTYHK